MLESRKLQTINIIKLSDTLKMLVKPNPSNVIKKQTVKLNGEILNIIQSIEY